MTAGPSCSAITRATGSSKRDQLAAEALAGRRFEAPLKTTDDSFLSPLTLKSPENGPKHPIYRRERDRGRQDKASCRLPRTAALTRSAERPSPTANFREAPPDGTAKADTPQTGICQFCHLPLGPFLNFRRPAQPCASVNPSRQPELIDNHVGGHAT